MRTISNAFFCGTPYQLITSIAIARMLDEESDLFVIPYFRNAERYAQNIDKLNVFRRVKIVPEGMVNTANKRKLSIRTEILKNYFKIDEFAEEALYPDTRYKRIFVSSKAIITRIVYLYYIKHGIDIELIYYDDGEGSYDYRLRTEPSIIDKIARVLIAGRKSVESTNRKKYLYEPELYKKINGNDDSENLIAIDHVFKDETFKTILSNVFEIKAKDLIDEDVIILDMIKDAKYDFGEVNRINETYKEIIEFFGTDDVIIKRHPRDVSKFELGIKQYENNNIPFESLCSQIDMNNKILVGVYSTSLVIPKLLFDQEPIVIMLYRLFKRAEQTVEAREKQNQFYDSFSESYDSDSRFFIPETTEELHEALNYALSHIKKSNKYEQ